MLTVKLHRVVLEFVIEYILLIMSYSLVDAVPCILQQYVSFIFRHVLPHDVPGVSQYQILINQMIKLRR